jgi:hypothetical protein
MTRNDINKIIFDNELFHGVLTGMGVVMDIEHLEKFAELVAAAEREACAELVSDFADAEDDGYFFRVLKDTAQAIRARGQE